MTSHLNEQLNLEFFSANLYLQMSAWCRDKGFEGASSFLKMHSREEMEHMHRLFDYLSDTGAMPVMGSIAAPPVRWNSLGEIIEEALKHEKWISIKIKDVTHKAIITQDYSTFKFMQWYVAEQHEAEKMFKKVLDKLALVGNTGEGLFLVDKDLSRITIEGHTVN